MISNSISELDYHMCHDTKSFFPRILLILLTAQVITVFLNLGTSDAETIEKFKGEVAIIVSNSIKPYEEVYTGFTSSPRFNIIRYDLNGDPNTTSWVVREIQQSRPRVIVSIGILAAKTAVINFSDIPLVFVMVLESDSQSLRKENVTGIVFDLPYDNRLQFMEYIKPDIKRIGMIVDPEKSAINRTKLDELLRARSAKLVVSNISSEKDVPSALRKLHNSVDAFLILPDPAVITRESFSYILKTCMNWSIPVMSYSVAHAKVGAVFSISPVYSSIGNQCSQTVEKILLGVAPSDISISYPRECTIAVNRKIARKLSMEINIIKKPNQSILELQ